MATGSLASWRSLLQHLQAKLDLRRRGILGLALKAGPMRRTCSNQGMLFPEDDRQQGLSRALALIQQRHPGSLGAASERLLARWGVQWTEGNSRS
jgi:hypothetical protein